MSESTTPQKPVVRRWSDLASLQQVVDDASGTHLRSTFALVGEHDFAWSGHAETSLRDLTLDEVNRNLERVRDEEIYPLPTLSTSTLPSHGHDVFIKRPKLHIDDYLPHGFLAQVLYEEAQVLEFLARHPHPNLVRYLGCMVKRSRITGIALERHATTLQECSRSGFRGLDPQMLIQGLRRGVDHLHALGLAHNDLNPSNIAIGDDNRPVILDFGSCRELGEYLLSAGTPGWADDVYTSAKENDEIAMKRIANWLANGGEQTIMTDS